MLATLAKARAAPSPERLPRIYPKGSSHTPVTISATAAPSTQASEIKSLVAMLGWLVPLVFAAGLVSGLSLSFLLGK